MCAGDRRTTAILCQVEQQQQQQKQKEYSNSFKKLYSMAETKRNIQTMEERYETYFNSEQNVFFNISSCYGCCKKKSEKQNFVFIAIAQIHHNNAMYISVRATE